MIEAVIFDYGGVISVRFLDDVSPFEQAMGYPPGSVYRLMFGDSDDHLEGPAHDYHLLEMGRIGLDEFVAGLAQRAEELLGRPLDLEAFATFAVETATSVHWAVVHRIRDLRDAGFRLGLLTNNVKEFGGHWRATFPVDELFDVVVDSSEVGMRKPDPEIYRLTCDRLGVEPGAAVFVDDNASNIAAAAALGMETVHFGTDPHAALRQLDEIIARRGTRLADRDAPVTPR